MAFIEYIFDKDAKAGDFDVTYVRNNREVLQFLLDNGADINNGDIMIKYIYEKKSLEHFVYLNENGADLSRRYYGDSTVLHTAVGTRNLELVTYFVEQGAELNAVDNKSRTPLDRCSSRATDIIEYLIAAGAKKFEEL